MVYSLPLKFLMTPLVGSTKRYPKGIHRIFNGINTLLDLDPNMMYFFDDL